MEGGGQRQDMEERTLQFALRVLKLCSELSGKNAIARTVGQQLLRSGTSIGANIAEGHSSHTTADFANKWSIACKEARETLYWLELLARSNTMAAHRLKPLMAETDEIIAILTATIKKLKKKTKRH